ncbi:hypothetical protein [Pantoea sp. DY-5]|uniref:ECs1072 family phage-associated protein n=1 Tax=Pantoea sp. DY-5 TaxID=2871488 RepID=UPI001C97E3C9|nr:hypothetical protein [Pantoea sp. DY-5]MBY4841002.1 hypothetical protein [Pantoea sp. DY-5]
MSKSLSHYELYNAIAESIYQTHGLDWYSVGSYQRIHIQHRTFLLMKFDMFLDSYRTSNNSKADHLHGKNAAIVLCCEKLKISPSVAREFSLDDLITTLHTEINSFPVPAEVLKEIINPYPSDLADMEMSKFSLGPFMDKEWDPELRYKLTSRAMY